MNEPRKPDPSKAAAHDRSHPHHAPAAGASCCGQAKQAESASVSVAAPSGGCGCAKSGPTADPKRSEAVSCCSVKTAAPGPASPLQLKDPVCGMTVTAESPHVLEHEGKPVYFCSAGCKTKFAADPARYMKSALPSAAPAMETPAPEGTIYTCPMHPEIRQDHPGACPKCGMALEPEMPSLDEGESPELVDFRRRFWWSLPLTIAVAGLAMLGHRLHLMDMQTQSWVELVVSVPIVLWAGWPFLVRGVQSMINRSPNMWTLIGLGTSAAFIYSVVATIAPGVFPTSFVSMGRVSVYFEAAAVIISLTLLGQLLELKARSQTSAAIKSLLGLAPKMARRINADGTEEDVPLDARTPRRLAARAPWRKSPGRRLGRRRQQFGRRVDADRRTDAGR